MPTLQSGIDFPCGPELIHLQSGILWIFVHADGIMQEKNHETEEREAT